jgi:hypothetical protein
VVLGADPLRDIGNTQRIDGVVVRGRYVDAAERVRILREVEEAAAVMPAAAVVTAGCACHGPARQAVDLRVATPGNEAGEQR